VNNLFLFDIILSSIPPVILAGNFYGALYYEPEPEVCSLTGLFFYSPCNNHIYPGSLEINYQLVPPFYWYSGFPAVEFLQ
jgi:hypothetical protein